jgi:hypothetical protein
MKAVAAICLGAVARQWAKSLHSQFPGAGLSPGEETGRRLDPAPHMDMESLGKCGNSDRRAWLDGARVTKVC